MTDDPVLMIGGLLRVPLEYVIRRVMERLEEVGLTGSNDTDFFLFGHLRRTNGMRLVELAKQTHRSKQSTLYDVNRLVTHGYVERTPDPSDKRAHLLRLTPLGWDVVRTSHEVMNEVNEEFRSLVGQKQFDNLTQTLLQIVKVIERRDETMAARGTNEQSLF